MKRLILVAALLVVAAAAPAQAHQPKRHHHHAAVAPSYPDSVTLEGKEYKVCKPGMQDDCVQAHQAGLGRTPSHAARPHHPKRHP